MLVFLYLAVVLIVRLLSDVEGKVQVEEFEELKLPINCFLIPMIFFIALHILQ